MPGRACFKGIFSKKATDNICTNVLVSLRIESIEGDRLIANDVGIAIRLRRIDAMAVHVRLSSCNNEGPCKMQRMKPAEIDRSTIHHVDGTGFGHQQVVGMDIGSLALGDVDEAWNVATQVGERTLLSPP